MEQARRTELPAAWPHRGKRESLHAAYTGSIIVVCEIDRGSDREKAGFESRVQETVRIDKIRTPGFHAPERPADPQSRDVPRWSAVR